MRKPSTPLLAIKKKCLECSGGDRKEVMACELKNCPLHSYRMGVDSAAAMLRPAEVEKKKEPESQLEQLKLF
jgi:hypothetical protein